MWLVQVNWRANYEIGRQRKQEKEAEKGKGRNKYEELRKAGRHKPVGKERSYMKLTRENFGLAE